MTIMEMTKSEKKMHKHDAKAIALIERNMDKMARLVRSMKRKIAQVEDLVMHWEEDTTLRQRKRISVEPVSLDEVAENLKYLSARLDRLF